MPDAYETVHGLMHSMAHDPEFMEMLAGFTAELTRRAQRLEQCALRATGKGCSGSPIN